MTSEHKITTAPENPAETLILPHPAAEVERNPGTELDMGWVNDAHINTQAIQRDAADIVSRRSIKKDWQVAWLLKALTMIDLTTLSGDDTPSNVKKLCAEALMPLHENTIAQLKSAGLDIRTGAVCVYHEQVEDAVKALNDPSMPVAAVSTGFPHAQSPFAQRVDEIKASVAAGAAEIDVVVTREQVLTGDWQKLYDEIKAYREACGESHMKVIFETGELGDMENVAKTSRVAMMAGADFIKTSTGKASINANLAVSLVMMNEIRNYHERTGYKIGYKPAGGISDTKTALQFLTLVKEVLGDEWLNPHLFRFGASSLLKDIKRQIYHQVTGNYADVDFMEQREIKFSDEQLAKITEIFWSTEYGPAPESDKDAIQWLADRGNKFGHYIGGEFITGKGKKTFKTTAPADGRELARFKNATKAEIDQAVEAAQKAQKEWAIIPSHKKKAFLYTLAREVQKNQKLFAVLESLDNGKPFRETYNVDIPLVARHLRYHAGMAQLIDEELPNHEPYGVAAQVIPWNFPLLMLAWKVAPALAAGNAVVLKPAENTPLTAMLFAEICKNAAEETGVPAAVINIVNGDGINVGNKLVNHEGVNKVAFTGSTEVGRIMREATAGTDKGLTLELGGKSPFIVFEDADLDAAVEGVVNAIWFNQGEVCCGGSRLLVQEGVYDKFIEKLKARMDKLRVGHSLDKSIDIGAVVDKEQQARIGKMVAEAREGGAEIYQPKCEESDGCFYPPTLVTNVEPTAPIMQDEVFGPVVCATTFRTHSDAVKLANQTSYGLAASIWTEKGEKATQVAAQLEAGVIWINGTNQFDAAVGFGGYKESGFGREGGIEGMKAYLKPKYEKPAGKADVSKPVTAYDGVAGKAVNQTMKHYIGGAQKRPDSGYTRPVVNAEGKKVADIGIGNRKDIRNAVAAAEKAKSWAGVSSDTKSQILDFIAENLSARENEVVAQLQDLTGCSEDEAREEFRQSITAIFRAAALSDKYEGRVHQPPGKNVVLNLKEPKGIIGISCPNEKPLLSMISMVSAAIAMGNRVVVTPSEKYPTLAKAFFQVLDTSDVPGGVVNIVTGDRDELADTMSSHEAVDAVWYHGSAEGSEIVGRNAARSNLKEIWANNGNAFDWETIAKEGMRDTLLSRATQDKNVWVPWGAGTGPK